MAHPPLWPELDAARLALGRALLSKHPDVDPASLDRECRDLLNALLFALLAERHHIVPHGKLAALLARDRPVDAIVEHIHQLSARLHTRIWPDAAQERWRFGPSALNELGERLLRLDVSDVPVETMGRWHEAMTASPLHIDEHGELTCGPDRRRIHGVFYTPARVARRIVQLTLGPLVAGRSPDELDEVALLDPACGAGAFLLEAMRFLCEHALEWYATHRPRSWRKAGVIRLGADGEWRLTTRTRVQLLARHVHGMDVDLDALRLAHRALMLEALDGELDEEADGQLTIIAREVPSLEHNLLYGDALFERDGELGVDPMIEFTRWFERQNPGFDAVVGNPPYVLLQSLGDGADWMERARERYRSAAYKVDTYALFFERGLELARRGGRLGYITPNTYLTNTHAEPLRRVILEESSVELVETYAYPVFDGVSVDTAVTVLVRGAPEADHRVSVLEATSPGKRTAKAEIPQHLWAKDDRVVMDLSGDVHTRAMLEAIDAQSIPLGEVASAYFGLQTHDRDTFVSGESRGPRWMPCIDGGNINRYYTAPPEEWVHMTDEAIKSGGDMSVHAKDRIGVRQIGLKPIASLVPGGWVTLNTIYNVYVTDDESLYDRRYLLAVMSSSLVGWYWVKRFSDHKRSFPKVKKAAILGIPIPALSPEDEASIAHRDAIVHAVDDALAKREALATTDDPDAYDVLLQHAKEAEARVDRLVLDAFGVSDEVRSAIE